MFHRHFEFSNLAYLHWITSHPPYHNLEIPVGIIRTNDNLSIKDMRCQIRSCPETHTYPILFLSIELVCCNFKIDLYSNHLSLHWFTLSSSREMLTVYFFMCLFIYVFVCDARISACRCIWPDPHMKIWEQDFTSSVILHFIAMRQSLS